MNQLVGREDVHKRSVGHTDKRTICRGSVMNKPKINNFTVIQLAPPYSEITVYGLSVWWMIY